MKAKKENIGIVIVFLIVLIIAFLSISCSANSELCTPSFSNGKIIKVTDNEVWTVNYLGYEIPHKIAKNDTINYVVGGQLIFND